MARRKARFKKDELKPVTIKQLVRRLNIRDEMFGGAVIAFEDGGDLVLKSRKGQWTARLMLIVEEEAEAVA